MTTLLTFVAPLPLRQSFTAKFRLFKHVPLQRLHTFYIPRTSFFTMPATEAQAKPAEEVTTTPTAPAEEPGKAEIAEKYDYPVLLYTIVSRDAEAAIKFYEKALGGKVKYLYRDNSGKIMHSVVATEYGLAVSINDYYESEHLVQPAEQGTGAKNARGAFNYISIPKGKGSADECVERMREAGAEIVAEPKDAFYGHRIGKVVDVYGVGWVFAHEIEKKEKK